MKKGTKRTACTKCGLEYFHTKTNFAEYKNKNGETALRYICKACDSTRHHRLTEKHYEDRVCVICGEKFTPRPIKGLNKRKTCYNRQCSIKLKKVNKESKAEMKVMRFIPYTEFNENDAICNPFG